MLSQQTQAQFLAHTPEAHNSLQCQCQRIQGPLLWPPFAPTHPHIHTIKINLNREKNESKLNRERQ